MDSTGKSCSLSMYTRGWAARPGRRMPSRSVPGDERVPHRRARAGPRGRPLLPSSAPGE
jgi:hypothetical protein